METITTSIRSGHEPLSVRIASRLEATLLHPWFLPLSLLLFVAVRVAIIAFVPVEPSSDFAWYHNRAVAILNGEGYSERGIPTAYWPVGWPAFAAALYFVFGPHIIVLKLANLVFACASFFLVLALGRRMFASEPAARLAVFLLAIYPNNAAYTTLTSTEVFYTFLLLLGTWVFLAHRALPWLITCGLIFGYATLTKPQTLFMPLILVGIAFLFERGSRFKFRTLVNGVILYAALAAVITPWIYRNYLVFGEPVFISTNSGWALLVGNNPSSLASLGTPTDSGPEVLALRKEVFTVENQLQANRIARSVATEWIRENIPTYLLLMPIKAFSLWSIDGEAEWAFQIGTPWYEDTVIWFRAMRGLNQVFYIAVFFGFLSGGWLLLARWWRSRSLGDTPVWPLVPFAFAGYTTLQCMVMAASYRYKFPLVPMLIIVASWAITAWLSKQREAYEGTQNDGSPRRG